MHGGTFKDKKSTQNNIPKDLFEKHKRDPLQEVEPPNSEFQKKVNL